MYYESAREQSMSFTPESFEFFRLTQVRIIRLYFADAAA
jgi:hypothetical protein